MERATRPLRSATRRPLSFCCLKNVPICCANWYKTFVSFVAFCSKQSGGVSLCAHLIFWTTPLLQGKTPFTWPESSGYFSDSIFLTWFCLLTATMKPTGSSQKNGVRKIKRESILVAAIRSHSEFSKPVWLRLKNEMRPFTWAHLTFWTGSSDL